MRLFKDKFKYMAMALICGALTLTSCSDDDNSSSNTTSGPVSAKIAVFSDPHYFASSLGTSGAAFNEYVAGDRKLIAESQEISKSTISALLNENSNIVLVPGDLTKDGEKQCHQEFAALLKLLENKGKKVYVIPGNHDVANPDAYSFSGDSKTKIPSVSADEFATIYKDYGYGEAIAKDPNSLSYVAEPVNGMWLIAMDACRYKENKTSPVTGGRFSDETLTWVKTQLAKAKELNKTVIGMMHHGLVEHFSGQKTNPISSDYVVDNWQTIATDFANAGMKAVFTGHYHANDIASFTSGNNTIYDIETGSLVTSPCPYRIIDFSNNVMNISTKYVTSINYNTGGKTFTQYAADFLYTGMVDLVTYMLTKQYGVSADIAKQVAPIAAAAFVAHYKGDESMPAVYAPYIESFLKSSDASTQYLGVTAKALFTDLNPSDNNVSLTFTK
jgi:DNA repair exonuclease SbcCD nuclease subunit